MPEMQHSPLPPAARGPAGCEQVTQLRLATSDLSQPGSTQPPAHWSRSYSRMGNSGTHQDTIVVRSWLLKNHFLLFCLKFVYSLSHSAFHFEVWFCLTLKCKRNNLGLKKKTEPSPPQKHPLISPCRPPKFAAATLELSKPQYRPLVAGAASCGMPRGHRGHEAVSGRGGLPHHPQGIPAWNWTQWDVLCPPMKLSLCLPHCELMCWFKQAGVLPGPQFL